MLGAGDGDSNADLGTAGAGQDPAFPRTDRFRYLSGVGQGGFGVVFEAFDREWKAIVALKALRWERHRALIRFKHEFRSLANVRHPNLVRLYQLFADGDTTFFTMERLSGRHFNEAFQAPSEAAAPLSVTVSGTAGLQRPNSEVLPKISEQHLMRLPGAVRQLAEGLRHLHSTGHIHRDIKPSNVIMTAEERVVLLDFGLVDDAVGATARDLMTGFIPGTPGYISPEQLKSNRVSPASDWWAVGAVLAETLTGNAGRRHGWLHGLDAFAQVSVEDPEARGVKERLLVLARRLLDPDPDARAGYEEVLGALEGTAATGPQPGAVVGAGAGSRMQPFVGRQQECACLDRAFDQLLRGEGGWVRVHGVAGVGKSALLDDFARRVNSRGGDTWLFSTRCHDRELVPFRALDGLMDQIATNLERNTEVMDGIAGVANASAVAEIFGTLSVAVPGREDWRVMHREDRFEFRRVAFAAWRDAMASIAEKRNTVLVIDDAHWGDADSAELLSTLVARPARLLVVICYRSDDRQSPFLSGLMASMDAHGVDWVDVPLERMGASESRDLASHLLGSSETFPDSRVEVLARQSTGLPLFMVALANAAQTRAATVYGQNDETIDGQAFEQLVAGRVASLPPEARAIVAAACLSPAPLAERVLLDAVSSQPDARDWLVILDLDHLLIARPAPSGDRLIEPFHDRIRQRVVVDMEPTAMRTVHAGLASAIRAHYGEDQRPDLLFVHYLGSGEHEVAASFGERAGRKAMAALAFGQAGALFAEAAKASSDRDRRRRLLELHGDALAAGGRTAHAAKVYETVPVGFDANADIAVLRKAAESYLITGHQTSGLRLWREAAARLGLAFPRSPLAAALGAIAALARTRNSWLDRLLSLGRRDPRLTAIRADAALAAAKGLIAIDPMRGVFFGLRSLNDARAAGQAEGLVTSLAFVAAACLAAAGGISRRWALALLDEADKLAASQGRRYLHAIVTIARSQIAMFQGRWPEAASSAREGLEALAAEGHARTWEANMARQALLRALEEMGAFETLLGEAQLWLERSEQTEDVFGSVTARLTLGIAALATGTSAEADQHAAVAEQRWNAPPGTYSVQRFYATRIRILSALHRGDSQGAKSLLGQELPLVQKSMIFRIPTGRIDACWMRCRVDMSAAAEASHPVPSLLGALDRQARLLDREDHVPARAHAAFVRARVAAMRGHAHEAQTRLRTAGDLYGSAGMAPMVELVELCRLLLLDERASTSEALERFAAMGISDPLAWARSHGVVIRRDQTPRSRPDILSQREALRL